MLKVTSIYDGDSFRANLKGFPAIVGEHMAIRINGIDTEVKREMREREATSKDSKKIYCRSPQGI